MILFFFVKYEPCRISNVSNNITESVNFVRNKHKEDATFTCFSFSSYFCDNKRRNFRMLKTLKSKLDNNSEKLYEILSRLPNDVHFDNNVILIVLKLTELWLYFKLKINTNSYWKGGIG